MKLIIEIDNSIYDICKSVGNLPLDENDIMSSLIMQSIANGTPLEKHDEEVIKETVESIWGKPPYTEVLDKIRAEIEQNTYPIVHGVNNHELGMTLYGILQVIDKYREGDKE